MSKIKLYDLAYYWCSDKESMANSLIRSHELPNAFNFLLEGILSLVKRWSVRCDIQCKALGQALEIALDVPAEVLYGRPC